MQQPDSVTITIEQTFRGVAQQAMQRAGFEHFAFQRGPSSIAKQILLRIETRRQFELGCFPRCTDLLAVHRDGNH